MSNSQQTDLNQFDHWLTDDSDFAALVMRQWLEPVEGKDAVIFPPTYAKPERMRDEDWLGYNIDRFDDGTSVCQIDSVGSQANRMEPIFKREMYQHLVPQVVVKVRDTFINLLEAGHRAADAIVRFSDLAPELQAAFTAVRDGDATRLAKFAPTSLVFGAWDSRGTQVKLPRIVRSVIRAFNVKPLHRSAQYIPPVDYIASGLLDTPEGKQQQDAMSKLGLSHAPAAWSHGGVLVEGQIRRDATLNLAALRALRAGDDADPLPLRRYILGLSLVAFTAPQETFLREGCQLVPDPQRPADWSLVKHDGSRDSQFRLSHEQALDYATAAAQSFGVGQSRMATFNPAAARAELGQPKEARKKARRGQTQPTEEDPQS
jgi:CRISPR-associated protein Csb1